jgi:hypothetical protein
MKRKVWRRVSEKDIQIATIHSGARCVEGIGAA